MINRKKRLAVLGDDEDDDETEETDNNIKDALNPMKIGSMKQTNKIAATSNKKVKSPTVKR